MMNTMMQKIPALLISVRTKYIYVFMIYPEYFIPINQKHSLSYYYLAQDHPFPQVGQQRTKGEVIYKIDPHYVERDL